MQGSPPPSPSIWLRAALRLTTAPVRAEGVAAIRIAAGWVVRTAVPKWACVWRNHPDVQCRLRTIVMPEPWNGWVDPLWQALLHQRLYEFGLRADEPEPWLLGQAEREVFARLAPPWTKMMAGPYR